MCKRELLNCSACTMDEIENVLFHENNSQAQEKAFQSFREVISKRLFQFCVVERVWLLYFVKRF